MTRRAFLPNALVAGVALMAAGARFVPGSERNGPVLTAAAELAGVKAVAAPVNDVIGGRVAAAKTAFGGAARTLSHPSALDKAFHAYYAYQAAHPNEVKKPLLYFVDYGLPSTAKRGYVFDMSALTVVDGPFTVAHGRGSSSDRDGVPTRFSNASGSAATSLGLYLAQELYDFRGHTGGRAYSAVGMRLQGLSTGFNDKARERRVVAHGAPYVTGAKAGRSEGCPAMEPARAARLLPRLAEGGMVFLFAPVENWMDKDPWVTADGI